MTNLIKKRKNLIKQYRKLWKLKNPMYIYEKGNEILNELKNINNIIDGNNSMAGPVEIAKRIAR